MGVWFPKKSHNGYYDKALNKTFYSKSEKEMFMKAHHLVEDGSMENEKHRENRLVEEINYHRAKAGLKTKTKEQLIGDAKTRSW
ncbi:MAG: hypothetical protein ABH851_04970 [Methanobacteriota archaeon]